ncbi:unnamed protein product [Cunninghamella echinulata]
MTTLLEPDSISTNDINSNNMISNRYKKSRYSMPGDWVEFSYYDEGNHSNTNQYEDINEVFTKHYLWKTPSSSTTTNTSTCQEKITEQKNRMDKTNGNIQQSIIIKDDMDGINKNINKEGKEEKADITPILKMNVDEHSSRNKKKHKLVELNCKVTLENDQDSSHINMVQCNSKNDDHDDEMKKNTNEEKEETLEDHISNQLDQKLTHKENMDSSEENTDKLDDDFDVIEDINTGNTIIESNNNIESDDGWEIL